MQRKREKTVTNEKWETFRRLVGRYSASIIYYNVTNYSKTAC